MSDAVYGQRFFEDVVAQSPVILSQHDLDGRFRFVSAAAKRYLGYEPDELVGEDPFAYMHPQDVNRGREVHEAARADTTPVEVVLRMRTAQGAYVAMLWRGRVVVDDTGEPACFVSTMEPAQLEE